MSGTALAPPADSAAAAAPPPLAQAEIEAVYDEFARRLAAGDQAAEQDLLRRYPAWRDELRVMFDCHRLFEAEAGSPEYPAAGEVLCGFQLIREMGRGARGRVWLASQPDLANRQVVLKFTPSDGEEHLSLARLQHTNIVPVYSVQSDAERRLRVLCMPYFGRATLAGVLQSLAGVPAAARSGRHFVDAIDEQQELPPAARSPSPAPTRDWLGKLSYVHAACWVVSRLADALHFAHEHGLLHLDVKPSNVLLALDGQPMLLDFHLARGPLAAGKPAPGRLGGTPGYMPPEQRAAMRAIDVGEPLAAAVDAKADIFALGAVMRELLGGAPPSEGESPPLTKLNSQVSEGLAGIVETCLAARAEDRYPTAAALADDLRRHLTDQPLLGAPNRSLAERWRKWRRRRPRAFRAAGTLLIVLAALGIAAAGWWSQVRQRHDDAEQALREGRAQLEDGDAASAAATFERGLSRVEHAPFSAELAAELERQYELARRGVVVERLHQLAEEIRPLFAERLSEERLRPLAASCAELWSKRQEIAALLGVNEGPTASSNSAAADLLDVAIFGADVELQLAGESADARRHALQTLDEAEALLGPSRALEFQRRRYRGQPPLAAAGELPQARSAFEHYAVGRALLTAGELAAADQELAAARALDPADLWTNFYFGVCAGRLGRHQDAVAAFSVCIGAAPRVAASYHNRALAHEALGRTEAAVQDRAEARRLQQ